MPASADIGDVAFLLALGYRTFMLGDAVCFRRDSVLEALNLLQAVAGEFRVRVALAQINTCVGDLEGNVERCLAAIETARGQDADLVVLPEMAVPGYPPRDILFDPSFVEAVAEATADLAWRARGGPPVVVGTLMPSGRRPAQPPGPAQRRRAA